MRSYYSGDSPDAVLCFATVLINPAPLSPTFIDESYHQCLLETSSGRKDGGRKDDSPPPHFDRIESHDRNSLVLIRAELPRISRT